jgi:hypothetical protein
MSSTTINPFFFSSTFFYKFCDRFTEPTDVARKDSIPQYLITRYFQKYLDHVGTSEIDERILKELKRTERQRYNHKVDQEIYQWWMTLFNARKRTHNEIRFYGRKFISEDALINARYLPKDNEEFPNIHNLSDVSPIQLTETYHIMIYTLPLPQELISIVFDHIIQKRWIDHQRKHIQVMDECNESVTSWKPSEHLEHHSSRLVRFRQTSITKQYPYQWCYVYYVLDELADGETFPIKSIDTLLLTNKINKVNK